MLTVGAASLGLMAAGRVKYDFWLLLLWLTKLLTLLVH